MKFSVLISVYKDDDPGFLDQSLYSIWDQQSLRPNQVVLVKDGPLSPQLNKVINEWQHRLTNFFKVVSVGENIGLGAALNIGLQHCLYDLVARMDSDDISLPDRFKKQVNFMYNNSDVSASSAQLEEWDQSLSNKLSTRHVPENHDDIVKMAKLRSPLSHPLAIFRKKDVLDLGGYPPLRKGQDYALWSLLLINGYRLRNLPDVLLKMRAGDGLFKRRGWSYFCCEAKLISFQYKIGFIGTPTYIKNMSLKGVLRLMPAFAQRLVYKYAR